MGTCACAETQFDSSLAVNLSEFEIKYAIGRGGFGRVWRVTHKKTGQVYAMKEMRKDLVVSRRSVPSIMNERRLLGILKHPLIVNLHFAFQDMNNLFLVVDLMSGGDFRFYMIRKPDFDEGQLRFFAACLLSGFEYLHTNNIVHRDIKPENLVLDQKGYVHITDFGIARMTNSDNSNVTSGTPGYMAPEVLCAQDHRAPVDYFALGVILFEAAIHFRPYGGKVRKEIRDAVLAKQVQMKPCQVPHLSVDMVEFINQLIQRRPENRLGFKGVEEVKSHKVFEGFQWDQLLRKELESPFKFESESNFDYEHVTKQWDTVEEKITPLNSQKLFAGYLYDGSMFTVPIPK
jgi:serum/glucocorticoid-regulated kinase 2